MINTCIHIRSLEGDGQEPSRYESEGRLFKNKCVCLSWTYVKGTDRGHHGILKRRELSEFVEVQKCVCLHIDNAYK